MNSDRPHYWILEDGEPRPAKNLAEWGEWYADPANFRIAHDQVTSEVTITITTTFLGTDHTLPGQEGPVLFESLICGGSWGAGTRYRYRTRTEAIRGHAKLLTEARRTACLSDSPKQPEQGEANDDD